MALTISQIAAASYPAVLAEMRKPTNQWVENAALRAFQKFGFIKRQAFGENIEVPLDYRPHPDAAVLANDQDANPMIAADILTSAVYSVGQLNVPVTWTKADEVKNPTENQKVALVRSRTENAINTHDDLIEQLIFTSSVAGGDEITGFNTLLPTSGQGTIGGIDANAEAWWRHPVDTYTDGTDIEAGLRAVFNDIAKGSGASIGPKLIISGSDPNALYEAQLQGQRRYGTEDTASGGFDAIMFRNCPWVFSQYGGTTAYILNPKSYKMLVDSKNFRDQGETVPIQSGGLQNAFGYLIYTAMQFVISNKSRLGVLYQA